MLEQQQIGQRADRQKQALAEIGRERQFAGRDRAEMIERHLAVDQRDRLIDHQRGDDRLGVDEELRKIRSRRAWLRWAPGVRSGPLSAIAADRLATASATTVSVASRVDIGDGDDQREGEQLAQPEQRREGALLAASAKLRAGVIDAVERDGQQRRQRQQRRAAVRT